MSAQLSSPCAVPTNSSDVIACRGPVRHEDAAATVRESQAWREATHMLMRMVEKTYNTKSEYCYRTLTTAYDVRA